jgi:uncharacterized membrane protein (DUF485 family)
MADRQYDWSAIAKNPKFIELHHKKTAFLFGWWIEFFVTSLPILPATPIGQNFA